MLLATGVILSACSYSSRASQTISSAIIGPAPTVGAYITSPTSAQRFNTLPIAVTGTCPSDAYVKILRNNVFAGTTYCGLDGNFNLQIDLVPGQNNLVAQVYDIFDRQGPTTPGVTVFYDPPPPPLVPVANPRPNPGPTTGNPIVTTLPPLTINSDTILYRGAFPFDSLSWVVNVSGGKAPYAINLEWGDGKSNLYSSQDGKLQAVHSYSKPGNYTVIVRASDANGNTAYLQLITIINGKAVALAGTGGAPLGGGLQIAWPLWVTAFLMMISFWLGERHRKGRMLSSAQGF